MHAQLKPTVKPKGQTVCASCHTLLRAGDPRRLKIFGICDECRRMLERMAGIRARDTVVGT